MAPSLPARLATLPPRRTALWGLALAVPIELITDLARFGLNLQATRDTGVLAHLTFGLRIHHGYLGLLLCMLAWLRPGLWRNLALVLGVALLTSDLAHHLAVLWPITGSPQFDLVYPAEP